MAVVLDTNIIVSALRSPKGASAELLRRVLDGIVPVIVSVPLVLEYEASCMEPRQRLVSGLSETDIGLVIEALCKVGRPVEIHFLWRPQLRDAADEMVLETAIAGGAEAIVTFNRRDFGDAPARFGVALISPPEALERMKR